MKDSIVLIHPLDYLFTGLEASEVIKMDLVNVIR